VAFAPQGTRLAAGSQQGRVEVFAVAGGASAWSLQRPGRVIKQVAFDASGERLYVGEQGPEGRVAAYALTASGGEPLWALDTAQDLGAAAPADPRDPYAWVTQPGAYRLLRVGGDVLAAFSRSWSEAGQRHARSRLYRLDGETGSLRWAYPAEGAQPGILPWFALDAAGGRLALPVQSPTGAAAGEIRATEVVLLDLATGRPVARRPIEPIPPYPVAGIWRGLALQPGGGGVAVSSEDGRAFLWRQDAGALQPVTELRLVEPVRLGGIPLAATNGTLAATADAVIFATGPTYVPPEFGGGGEPTLDHPRGNTLYAHDWRGKPRWVWRMDNDLQGLAGDSAGRWLAVAQGAERPQTAGRFHGVALLDLQADTAGRAVFRLPLEGRPVYGAMALSGDGRWLAVAEAPRSSAGEARPHGAARLHLVR
jgi:outer membrane protein assembly factor BamB